MGRLLVFSCLTMNLLGWNLPAGNERFERPRWSTWASLLSELPRPSAAGMGPPGCPLFSGHRAGAPLQSGCLPPPPGRAVIPAVSEAVALWEHRWEQGCSHHALPPLLIHQSQRTEPAGHGPSFQICALADSTHLPLPWPSNLTDGPVGSVASKAPSRVTSSGAFSRLFPGSPPPLGPPLGAISPPPHPGSAESRGAQDPLCLQGPPLPSYSEQPCDLPSTCWSAGSLRTQAAGSPFPPPPVLVSMTHVGGPSDPLVSRCLACLTSGDLPNTPTQPAFLCSHPGP